MDQDHQKKEGYNNMENAIISHNWKELIKPNKLNIKSSDDKSFTTVQLNHLKKDML